MYLRFVFLTAPSDHVPPIIRQGPANQTLAPGSTIQLHCHIMGNPTPSIQWEKDGQRILGNDDRIMLMENGTFQISNLQVLEPPSNYQSRMKNEKSTVLLLTFSCVKCDVYL